jgi:hypothetical protein
MKRGSNSYYCFIMLVTAAVLTLASGSSQSIYASSDNNHKDHDQDSGDSSFSLPFGQAFADQSDGDDDDDSGGDDDDMDVDDLPFP